MPTTVLVVGDAVIIPALKELNSTVGKTGFLQIMSLVHICEPAVLIVRRAVSGQGLSLEICLGCVPVFTTGL